MTSIRCVFGFRQCQSASGIISQYVHSLIINKKMKKKYTSLPVRQPFTFEKLRRYFFISVTVKSACQQASGTARLCFRNSTISNDENTAKQKNGTSHHRFKQHNQQRKTTQASTEQSFLPK